MAEQAQRPDGAVARRLATAVVVLLLLLPVATDSDGLPLSTYPMYAGNRSDTLSIVVAQGVQADGERVTLSLPEIARTRDPLIAQSFLNDAVAVGSAETVCREIAARVDRDVDSIEIARERHNVVDYVQGDSSLLDRDPITTCGTSS